MKIKKVLRQIYSVSDRSRLLNDSDYFIDCMVKYYKPEYKEDCRLLERAIRCGAGNIVYQFVQQDSTPTKDERDTFFNLLRNKAGFTTDETNDVIDALFYMVGFGNKKTLLVAAISAAAVLAAAAAVFLLVSLGGSNRIIGEWNAYYDAGDAICDLLTKHETDASVAGFSLTDEEYSKVYSKFRSYFASLKADSEISISFDENGKCKIKIQPVDIQDLRQQIYDCYIIFACDIAATQENPEDYIYEIEGAVQSAMARLPDSIFTSTGNYYYLLKGSNLYLSESSKATENDPYLVVDLPSKDVLKITRNDGGINDLNIPITLQRSN